MPMRIVLTDYPSLKPPRLPLQIERLASYPVTVYCNIPLNNALVWPNSPNVKAIMTAAKIVLLQI